MSPARITPIVLAFGANLGDRHAQIRDAQAALAAHPQISEFRASELVESVKVGTAGLEPEAPPYLNGVATATTTLTAPELLQLLQELEISAGRERTERWGDRTLDIDIVQFGGTVQRTPELTLPHPRAHERDFVLVPWLSLDPNAVLLRHGRVADLLTKLRNTQPATTDPQPKHPAQQHTVTSTDTATTRESL